MKVWVRAWHPAGAHKYLWSESVLGFLSVDREAGHQSQGTWVQAPAVLILGRWLQLSLPLCPCLQKRMIAMKTISQGPHEDWSTYTAVNTQSPWSVWMWARILFGEKERKKNDFSSPQMKVTCWLQSEGQARFTIFHLENHNFQRPPPGQAWPWELPVRLSLL